jgi:hypothetical protein
MHTNGHRLEAAGKSRGSSGKETACAQIGVGADLRRRASSSGRPQGSDGLHMERPRRGPLSTGELEWATQGGDGLARSGVGMDLQATSA